MPSFPQSFTQAGAYAHNAGAQDSENYPGGADQYVLFISGNYTGLQLSLFGSTATSLAAGVPVQYPLAAALENQPAAGNHVLTPADGATVRYFILSSHAFGLITVQVVAIGSGTVNLELIPIRQVGIDDPVV